MLNWIKVTDKLPPCGFHVLAIDPEKCINLVELRDYNKGYQEDPKQSQFANDFDRRHFDDAMKHEDIKHGWRLVEQSYSCRCCYEEYQLASIDTYTHWMLLPEGPNEV